MTPAAVLARLDEAGVRLGIRQDGGISLRPIPPPDLLAEARRHRDHLAHLIGLRRALANDVAPQPTSDGDNPSSSCPACGHNQWWRILAMSGGPGPWRCQACVPPEPEHCIDATVIPDTHRDP